MDPEVARLQVERASVRQDELERQQLLLDLNGENRTPSHDEDSQSEGERPDDRGGAGPGSSDGRRGGKKRYRIPKNPQIPSSGKSGQSGPKF